MTPRMDSGSDTTSCRRVRASSYRARRVATPTWHWASRAHSTARSSVTPWRATSSRATSSAEGTLSVTARHRERMVTSTSMGEGAHSSQMVCGGGSSMLLSITLEVRSVMRSASSTIMMRQAPTDGRSWARTTSSRASSMLIWGFSVTKLVTSAWVPANAVRHAWHCPHPVPCSHSSAAASARAAVERPEPGGPVNSQAWVGSLSRAARCSCSTTRGCPTTSSHTLTAHLPGSGGAAEPRERPPCA